VSYEDAGLLRRARSGDRRARNRLVARYLGVVRSLAAHYRDLGLPYDDLVQEGSVGLLEAIDDYDARRGTSFEAYARFRIRRAMRNALTDTSRLIRLPKQVVERRRAIERTEARFAAARGRPPSVEEIAAATGLSAHAITDVRDVGASPVSLDRPVLADGSTLESLLPDQAARDPEVEAVENELAQRVDDAVVHLPPRQHEIVSRHFGIGRAAEDVADVAADLHLSQQRTRTIERDALYRLRDELERMRGIERYTRASRRTPTARRRPRRIRTSPRR
jgi:RNA polymerase primary sigma factor